MVIAKYTDNLYASEVYRELERQAVRKGQFKPSDSELVKLAAQQINQEQSEQPELTISAEPSDDLVQDVARLAYAMRRKGFENQADDIEQKLLLYKQAESALYNVTPESNMDFVHFSHRDGDVEIIEGSGELGTVETIDSLAKKIREVAEKEPSGKAPGKSASLEELAALIKEAATEFAGVYNELNQKIHEFPNIAGLQLTFSGQNFLVNEAARKLYAKVAGKSENVLINAANMYKQLKDLGFTKYDQADFFNFIKINFNSADRIRYLAKILGADTTPVTKGVVGQYQTPDGGKFNTLAEIKARWPDWDYSQIPAQSSPQSIWGVTIKKSAVAFWTVNMAGKTAELGGWYMIPERANAYAETLRQAFYTRFSDPAYGANFDDLDKAIAYVAKLPEGMYNKINAINVADPESVRNEDTQVLDISKAIAPVSSAQTAVNSAVNSDTGKITLEALKALGHADKAAAIERWYTDLKNTNFPKANKAITGKSVAMIDVSPAFDRINRAITLWREAAALVPRDRKFQARVADSIGKVRKVRDAIAATGLRGESNKPENQLLDVIEPLGYKSFQELLDSADKLVGVAQGDKDLSAQQAGAR